MSKYYYHGINSKYPVDILFEIFNSGFIKSKRFLGRTSITGYNGLDYISLCRKESDIRYQKSKLNGYSNAFYSYILEHFCLIISDEIETVKPTIVKIGTFNTYEDLKKLYYRKDYIQYSDMFDEWQARDIISIYDVVGIGIPFHYLSNLQSYNFKRVKELYLLAQSLGLDIVDSSFDNFIEEYETIKESSNKQLFLDRKKEGVSMSKYYYHGIRNGLVLDKILNIFKDKGITSKRLQHNLCNSGFNGLDYISICKKEEESLYHKFPNNAFYNYVQDHFCFILTDDLDVIKPEIIPDAKSWNRFELINYFNSKPGMQFSDMFDEWQVKDYIPLSKIIGIGIPVANLKSIFLTGTMYSSETSRESLDILKKIIFLANELKLDIIDSSELDFVTKYENQKELQQTIEFKLNI